MTDMNQILNDYLDNLFNEYEQEQPLPQDTWDGGITDEQ
jgi:hypothetical protein